MPSSSASPPPEPSSSASPAESSSSSASSSSASGSQVQYGYLLRDWLGNLVLFAGEICVESSSSSSQPEPESCDDIPGCRADEVHLLAFEFDIVENHNICADKGYANYDCTAGVCNSECSLEFGYSCRDHPVGVSTYMPYFGLWLNECVCCCNCTDDYCETCEDTSSYGGSQYFSDEASCEAAAASICPTYCTGGSEQYSDCHRCYDSGGTWVLECCCEDL